ncbi:MAG: protein kinase [Acidimicrobiia bacterium]|nr:protein kinase [Acidimicrobiia bacterium]
MVHDHEKTVHDHPIRRDDARADRVLGGRYRLEQPLASGGMAQVWEATDTVLGRRVAVKILHDHLANDPVFLERFRAEARIAARLSHPGIVAIFDTASEDGIEAIVMELLEGIDLRRFLDDHGVLSPELTVELGAQVADALQAAHAAELVHRDIKPANIMLVDDRRVKVTDFGIAKPLQSGDLTTSGTLVGTAKYLAPEQVTGDPVDGRADVYALGVVLFECLTGKVPFSAESDLATAIARTRTDAPRVRQLRTTVPIELDAVIDRALARSPANRWTTAADFRAALLAALDDTGVTVAPPPMVEVPEPVGAFMERERRWLVPMALIVIVAGALALAGALIGTTEVGQGAFDRAREAVGFDAEPDDSSAPIGTEPDDGQSDTVGNAPEDDGDLRIVAISTFDPEGSGEPGENDSRVSSAIDGDPATTWSTEGYDSRAFGGLKSGVGIVISLNEPTAIGAVEIVGPTQSWAASIYAADAAAPELSGWGPAVAESPDIDGTIRFELNNVEAGALMVWITDLGDGPPRVRVEIAELALYPG